MNTIKITRSHPRHGLNRGLEVKAVPVYADYAGGKHFIGHRIISEVGTGNLVFPDEYVVIEDKPKAKVDDAALINKTANLLVSWENASYTKSPEEDRRDFAADLVRFFKAHLCG